ncbi:MAG TPA: choline dehydrogenase [Blastocatellia bacterium]|nr:choline dehydrogenase [Blastocatellia bacterium]
MFDYVIIGAGSAGCVLAHRLTEDSTVKVLLLEAGGPDRQLKIQIPAAFPKLFRSECDWAYETEEQPRMHGRKIFWPRGKVLGGSSSINAMIYSRANRRDHDRWAELGIEGWSYREVLPYYRKSENNERGADEYHGVGSLLNVADLRYVNPLSHQFIEAAQQAGYRRTPDFNGDRQEGVGFFQVTQKNGRRHSAAAAFLKPALSRSNLVVKTRAHVIRLLFDHRRVTGVVFRHQGQIEQVRASREVILSGGAVNSPQLLMLSGIGPADQLRALDLPVVAELPGVGQNLQDHQLIGVEYELRRPIGLHRADTPRNLANYLIFKKGPLTSCVAEAGGFIKTRSGIELPDVEMVFAPVFYMDNGFKNPDLHGFSIGLAIQHPESRGQIRLRSSDPFAAPQIQPNYLAAESDLASGIEGVKIAREILNSKFFDRDRGPEWWPGPQAAHDEGIAEHIRRTAETIYHPVGTCKMGRDAMSVVDDRLRVHGLEGLRVVDASVIPIQITGHTNAPTMMIAEKAADLIREAASAS